MSLNVFIIAGPLISLNVEHSLYEISPATANMKNKNLIINCNSITEISKLDSQSMPSCPSFADRMYLKNRRISGLSDVGLFSSFSSLKWKRRNEIASI